MDDYSEESFKPLYIEHKNIESSSKRYRVYTDTKNYTVVEADNAFGAFRASGLKKVHHILRDSIFLENTLNLEKLLATPAHSNPPKVDNKAVAAEPDKKEVEYLPVEPPASESPKTETPKAEAETAAPLSNDDIDKLLQS